jgi:hypothetical protein
MLMRSSLHTCLCMDSLAYMVNSYVYNTEGMRHSSGGCVYAAYVGWRNTEVRARCGSVKRCRHAGKCCCRLLLAC